jgi:hypothetical protein
VVSFQDDLLFQVDFNNFDDEGELLKGSLWHGSSRRIPRRGERVLLKDGEGNRCWAWVRDQRGVILFFELDDATWVSGEGLTTTTGTPNVVATFSQ